MVSKHWLGNIAFRKTLKVVESSAKDPDPLDPDPHKNYERTELNVLYLER